MTILQKYLVFVPLCFVIFAGLFGWLVMLLWNWLMPGIFGLPEISFLQTLGWNNRKWFPRLKLISTICSTVVILMFAAVAVLFCIGYTPGDIGMVM